MSVIIILSAHVQNGAAFRSTCCNWRKTSPHNRVTLSLLDSSSCADNDIFDPPDDDDGDGSDNKTYAALQRRLHLTADEVNLIQNRIGGITPRRKKQPKKNHPHDDDNNDVTAEEEHNLTYLKEHLSMTTDQLRRTVVGYPLVLKRKRQI